MPLSPERSAFLRIAGIVLLALASWWLPKLALPTCFLVLLVALSLPKLRQGPVRLWANSAIVLSGLLATGAFVGFVLHEAIPGVIAGGNQDAHKRAIGFLRSLVVAEDRMRTKAWLDADADLIGSAGTFAELSGLQPLRNARDMDGFPLFLKPDQVEETSDGTVVVKGGYLFKLCLPKRGGGWITAGPLTEVDEEAGERSFEAYAWPHSFSAGSPQEVFFIDAYERILRYAPKGPAPLRYQGTSDGPPCGAIQAAGADWVPWKDKTARPKLPGDRLVADTSNP
jgi:hypothetical protein